MFHILLYYTRQERGFGWTRCEVLDKPLGLCPMFAVQCNTTLTLCLLALHDIKLDLYSYAKWTNVR